MWERESLDKLECVPQAYIKRLLKPSGLCFTLVQLKRRFAVHVVSVTGPGPLFRMQQHRTSVQA